MLKIMKNTILALMTLFLFTGCFTSSLSLNEKQELTLNYDANEMLLSSELVSSELLNFKDLFVSRYKLKSTADTTLFYEVAKTSLEFEFSYSGLYTVMYLFDDAREYEMVYERNNLALAQIKLQDAKYINVIIQASDSQVYTFAYGFSDAEFLNIANTLIEKDKQRVKKLKHDAITFTKTQVPTTNWSDEVVFFTPLIMPFRASGSK